MINNKPLLDKKIQDYMNKVSARFNSVFLNSKTFNAFDESVFDFNPPGDIAVNLHNSHGNNLFHRHDFFEMILSKGELCLVNSKAYHAIITENDEDNILFNFMFKKSFFSRYFLNLIGENNALSSFLINYLFDENSRDTYLVFDTAQSDSLKKIIFLIINEFIDECPGFRSVLESLYVILFIEISRNSSKKSNNLLKTNEKAAKFNEIMNYIEENFATTNLQETAMHFHYHPNYLSKEVKKHTNKTYSESSHFYHIFKKNFTMTPNEYRRQVQK